jgi:uncharacterized damage-inducible protein DinB
MDATVIEQFASGGAKLRRAVAGLSFQELTAKPGPGQWSILEVVIHLVDSDSIAIDRMKRILIEDNPPLLYADETAYNDRLFPHEQSLEYALTLFDLGRRQFARVLRQLPPEAFERAGTHNRKGRVTVAEMVHGYIKHLDDHLVYVHGKRERLKNPVT